MHPRAFNVMCRCSVIVQFACIQFACIQFGLIKEEIQVIQVISQKYELRISFYGLNAFAPKYFIYNGMENPTTFVVIGLKS